MEAEQRRLWVYARSRAPQADITTNQMEGLLRVADKHHWKIVGASQDSGEKCWSHREGIREMKRAIARGYADIVLVESLGRISHDRYRLIQFLRFLQDHQVLIFCTRTDVRYETYIKRLADPFMCRAEKKGLMLPW